MCSHVTLHSHYCQAVNITCGPLYLPQGEPPALPGWLSEFDISGSMFFAVWARIARVCAAALYHGDSVLELLHVPRQKFNRLICSRACILVAAEICWRWSRRAWHAWCTNLSETLYEYIYGRSIYTPDSGSMVSDVRRVRGRLHRSASPEDWTQASAL